MVRSIDTSTRESAWTIAGDDKRWLAIEVVEHGADVELVGPGMPLNEVDTPPSRYAVEQLLGLKTADFE